MNPANNIRENFASKGRGIMSEYYARQKGLVRIEVTLSNGFSGVTFTAVLTELKRGATANKVAVMPYLPLSKNLSWGYRWLVNNKKTLFTCQRKVGKIVKKRDR
jgi:hypothetical protein